MAFYIRNIGTGLVLDVQGNSRNRGTPVVMWQFKGSKNQLWEYKNEMLYSKASGMVLDVNQNEQPNRLAIWEPHGRNNQKWMFEDDLTIKSRTGLVIDIHQENRSPGTPVIVFHKNGNWNQKFQVVPYCY